ncbi:MAG: HAD family hydrolase [Thermoplasmata archaeon]
MIKGVIFDIDGTILDSFESIYLSLSNILKKYNVENLNREELKEMMDYMSFEEIVLTLAKKYNLLDSEKILELSKDYTAYFKKSIKVYSRLFPGINNAIQHLSESFKLGVISYNPKDIVKIQLLDFDLLKYFPFVRGFEDVNGHKRVGIIEFSRTYGLDLNEIVYIGDQPKDIIEARLAGVRSIAVTYGVSKYDSLLKEHPDYFADSAKELLEIIQKK